MKLQRIAWVLALMMATYWVPSALAQDSENQKQDSQAENPNATSNATQTEPQPVPQPDNSKVKHDGGKSDVDAIGNRKMGGRGLGNCPGRSRLQADMRTFFGTWFRSLQCRVLSWSVALDWTWTCQTLCACAALRRS